MRITRCTHTHTSGLWDSVSTVLVVLIGLRGDFLWDQHARGLSAGRLDWNIGYWAVSNASLFPPSFIYLDISALRQPYWAILNIRSRRDAARIEEWLLQGALATLLHLSFFVLNLVYIGTIYSYLLSFYNRFDHCFIYMQVSNLILGCRLAL